MTKKSTFREKAFRRASLKTCFIVSGDEIAYLRLSLQHYTSIQNKTDSDNGHLVFSIFKEKQENNGFGDISSLFSCFFLEYREYKMSIFGICFILYFLKLSACRGFYTSIPKQYKQRNSTCRAKARNVEFLPISFRY